MSDDEAELISQGRGAIEQLTVNLTPQAQIALRRAAQESGDSLTDTVNRAIQYYDHGLQCLSQMEHPVPQGFWRQFLYRLGWRRA